MSGAPSSDLDALCEILARCKCLGISTGAGLSAASGIQTYRGADGQWNNIDPMSVASLEAFTANPGKVWAFFHPKRDKCIRAQPNAAHNVLASLSLPSVRKELLPGLSDPEKPPLYVTQNFDGLCRRALDATLEGNTELDNDEKATAHGRLIEMHGSCYRFLCLQCKALKTLTHTPLATVLADEATTKRAIADELTIPVEQLPRCGGEEWAGSNRHGRCGGPLRPAITWFGEVPEGQGELVRVLTKVDVLLVIGTTSLVHPAASYAATVKKNGGVVVVFNLGQTKSDEVADFAFYGPCEETVPRLFERLRELNKK
ncbi:sirtuin [Cylindrobasidium torrendii FP15055 ss-10]|uniref:Sirtuin n=1 Tax=Cylindrobasidium torrendii FP15055 ss-10 TaxID=1314674 RepID=A0A0D7B534_9AGAR|nr:sirtuin [Cylindrobasidium torrendii FP15055 ss-10]